MIRKNLLMSLYGALLSVAVTASIALALVGVGNLELIFVSALLGILPGALIGLLVGMLFDVSSRFSHSVDLLERINATWPYHRHFEEVLGAHRRHRKFSEQLIQLSAVEKIWQIPDVSPERFYRILIDALAHCRVWEGIHHGPIRALGYAFDGDHVKRMGEEYFKKLGEAVERRQVRARRIIILSKEDQKELTDPAIMQAFWEKTGSTVKSYWIAEEVVLRNIEKLGPLDDSALHDQELFLQYDRKREIVRFEADEKMKWVRGMFEKLDAFLHNEANLLGFQELTGEAVSSVRPVKPEGEEEGAVDPVTAN